LADNFSPNVSVKASSFEYGLSVLSSNTPLVVAVTKTLLKPLVFAGLAFPRAFPRKTFL
jgi:hypothetical protein